MDTHPCGAHSGTMSVTNPASEMEALLYVVTRLSERFPWAGEELIRDLVADELVDFGSAWMRDYIPVLVEGRVLHRLRALRPAVAS